MLRRLFVVSTVTLCLAIGWGSPTAAQVGKGLLDLNSAPEKDLTALPHLTPAIVKGLLDQRPFATIVDANTYLASQSLTPAQLSDIYRKAFVHVNLNTASAEEIMLIPGAGRRMVREFAEYRPWKTWAQFDKEIGKYVGAAATAALAQYTFIPMNANTASDADLLTVQGSDQAWVDKVKKGRPYTSVADLEKAAGKTQARFFVIQ